MLTRRRPRNTRVEVVEFDPHSIFKSRSALRKLRELGIDPEMSFGAWPNDPGLGPFLGITMPNPTGVAASDDPAFTTAYGQAARQVSGSGGGSSGSIIVPGAGQYQTNGNVWKLSDARIGMNGPGSAACVLKTAPGVTGVDAFYATDSVGLGANGHAAPISGFTIFGGATPGASVNGFHFGDRLGSTILDINVWGFIGTASNGCLFRNDNGVSSEGTVCGMNVQQGGGNGIVFDGNAAVGPSFDYSTWDFHVVGGNTTPNQNHNLCSIQNKAQMSGVVLRLKGNASSASTFTTTLLQVGQSTSDNASISNSEMFIAIEADTSAGTNRDIFVQGDASFTGGIANCHGSYQATNASGSWTAGSTSGSVLLGLAGKINAPYFSTAGVLFSMGPLNAFNVSNNAIRAGVSSNGSLQPGNTGGPGGRIWMVSGAPATPGGAITYVVGQDWCFRTDTPGTANQRLYVVTTGGTSPTWTGIL